MNRLHAHWADREGDREQGFTLIELLIVMVVLAILAALAIPLLRGQSKKSSDATARTDLRNLTASMEGYFASTNTTLPPVSFYWNPAQNMTANQYQYQGGTANTIVRTADNVLSLYVDNRAGFTGYCSWAYSPKGTTTFYYDSSVGKTVASSSGYPASLPVCNDVSLNGSTS